MKRTVLWRRGRSPRDPRVRARWPPTSVDTCRFVFFLINREYPRSRFLSQVPDVWQRSISVLEKSHRIRIRSSSLRIVSTLGIRHTLFSARSRKCDPSRERQVDLRYTPTFHFIENSSKSRVSSDAAGRPSRRSHPTYKKEDIYISHERERERELLGIGPTHCSFSRPRRGAFFQRPTRIRFFSPVYAGGPNRSVWETPCRGRRRRGAR